MKMIKFYEQKRKCKNSKKTPSQNETNVKTSPGKFVFGSHELLEYFFQIRSDPINRIVFTLFPYLMPFSENLGLVLLPDRGDRFRMHFHNAFLYLSLMFSGRRL